MFVCKYIFAVYREKREKFFSKRGESGLWALGFRGDFVGRRGINAGFRIGVRNDQSGD